MPAIACQLGPETLHLPRILCLHGAGVSAKVFCLQLRSVCAQLGQYFRLVFVDGPDVSEGNPGLGLVYGGMGPYWRFWPWRPDHPNKDFHVAVDDIEKSLERAMAADAGTGEWVGILGFSQGAGVAISILLENQLRQRSPNPVRGFAGEYWKFGLIFAGGSTPVALCEKARDSGNYHCAGRRFIRADFCPDKIDFPNKLETPTLHVHGWQDPMLELQRYVCREYCESSNTVIVEWNGGHRLPYKPEDVSAVLSGALAVAKATDAT